MANTKVGLKLLENGLDYILHALEHLENADENNRNYKYAVLHLYSGIELVLQEVLRKEHWALTFAKIENANKNRYRQNNFISLKMDQTIDRLINICEYDFDRSKFQTLKTTRNKIEHNAFKDEITIIKTQCSEAIHEILNFIANYNKKKETKIESSLLEQIREKLVQFDTFFAYRMLQIDELLQKEEVLFYCPVCSQKTYSIKKHFCLFCNVKHKSGKETMFYYLSKIGETQVNKRLFLTMVLYGLCPNCGERNIAKVSDLFNDKNHNTAFLCFDCGHKITIEEARKCKICMSVLSENENEICYQCNLKSSVSDLGSITAASTNFLKDIAASAMNLQSSATRSLADAAMKLPNISSLMPKINLGIDSIALIDSNIFNLSKDLFSVLEKNPYLNIEGFENEEDEDDDKGDDSELSVGEPI